MHSDEVRKSIKEWSEWASDSKNGNYDIALLKIWITFERYLGDIFLNYALGNPSETGYYPKLKIRFQDESQFNAFMVEGNKKYIEYINKIEKLSDFIFEENPFDIILKDADRKNSFTQLKALRNYIAHESEEARRKVINQCFGSREDKFLEPSDFLKSKPKTGSDSNYSIYIKLIFDVLEMINSELDANHIV